MIMDLKSYIGYTPDEKLNIFMYTLSTTNRTPEYYVNWDKVERNTKEYELELNTLNYLVGKEHIELKASLLCTNHLGLVKAIPSLIASRNKELGVLIIDANDSMEFYGIEFKSIDINQLDLYMEFIRESGLFSFM